MKIQKKNTVISVIGLGRVGLPLAIVFANEGYIVHGIGRDEKKISEINKGKMPFIEKGGAKLLKKVISKSLFATTDYSVISKSTYIILTLGTPIDSNMNPSYDQINTAFDEAKKYFRPGQTLILRSTVSPRTTQYVSSLIGDIKGITLGKNFYLSFCPEIIAEG